MGIKIKTVLAILLFLVVAIARASEQTNCADFAKNAGLYPYYDDKWWITPSGDVKVLDDSFGKRSTLSRNSNEIIITQQPMIGSNSRAEIFLDTISKKVNKIKIYNSSSTAKDSASHSVKIYSFEIKDGVCRPVQKTLNTIDGNYSRIEFNRYFCSEFAKYLKDHPEAYNCQCGNDKTNADIKAMFKKYEYGKQQYDYQTSFKITDRDDHSTEHEHKVAWSMGAPLYNGLIQLENCKSNLPSEYKEYSNMTPDFGKVPTEIQEQTTAK